MAQFLDLRPRAKWGEFFYWLLFCCFAETWPEYKHRLGLHGGRKL